MRCRICPVALAGLLLAPVPADAGRRAGRAAAAPSPAMMNLRGVVGADLPVTMTLTRTGDVLTGEYFYERRGAAYVPDALELVGRRAPDGSATLREADGGGNETGSFRGVLGRDWFAGDWVSGDGRRKLPFTLAAVRADAGADGERVERQSAESSGTKPKYALSSEWPKLVGPDGRADARMAAFNDRARALARSFDADFRALMKQFAGEGPPVSVRGYEQGLTYTMASLSPRAVSVSFEVYADTGGAHPNTNTTTLNFDRRAARPLRLKDLFSPGFDYRHFLSAQCRAALREDFRREEGLKDVPFPEGVAPEERNFACWTLTPQGLAIHFDRYQVAAYAEGGRDVILPWPLLGPHLRPGGPAAPLAGAAPCAGGSARRGGVRRAILTGNGAAGGNSRPPAVRNGRR